MYSWKASFIAALSEVNAAELPRRILEAVTAIEQRLRSPLEPGSEEHKELRHAQQAIAC